MPTYKELIAQRQKLDRQINEILRTDKSDAIMMVKACIAKHALTATDCGFNSWSARVTSTRPAQIKYRGPNGETWAGRGRAPTWLVAHEANGATREQFRVNE